MAEGTFFWGSQESRLGARSVGGADSQEAGRIEEKHVGAESGEEQKPGSPKVSARCLIKAL